MNHLSRSCLAALGAIVLGTALVACVTGVPEPGARGAEALAPLPEIRSSAPNPGMVWIPGVWHVDGVDQVWVPGHWAPPVPVP